MVTEESIKGYTYEQLATLCIQLQGLVTTTQAELQKEIATGVILQNKLRTIERVLQE